MMLFKEELTFDELHHLDVIRMCNQGPVNLKDKRYGDNNFTKPNVSNLIFQAELYSLISTE